MTDSAMDFGAYGLAGDAFNQADYRLYTDAAIARLEQERIFEGPAWCFIGLDVEVPLPGDYKTSWVGALPIILVRGKDGALRAMVNRCTHKGSTIVFDGSGCAERFVCPYHNWYYDLEGSLTAVAFGNGIKGQGGMPAGFSKQAHGLRRLRVATIAGLVFVSVAEQGPGLEEYLGTRIAHHIRRTLGRGLVVLGQYTQVMHNNWKLYMENTRDSYHASLLHVFFTTFRLNRLDMAGGMAVGENGWNTLSYTQGTQNFSDEAYADARALNTDIKLHDPSLVANWPEFADGIVSSITSVFPALVMQQISNSLAVRQLVPKGPDKCELVWTLLGTAEDSAAQTEMRVRQSNLVGPAGLVSMEDGIIGNFVQRSIASARGERTVMRMGGDGVASQESRVTEAGVRAFWKAWRDHMEPA
jgi:anthranilate 1,2-dioxygenase large subunit/terephthalate 1,2-dioxygenase oxygenase component alpha subunit